MHTQPWNVTAPGDKTRLLVMDRQEPFPVSFALLATTATDKVAIRIAGGCKGMELEDKAAMMEYFEQAFAGYAGMVWSGGTRQADGDGNLDPMVTDLPGHIARSNGGCIALGSTPRTSYLRLVEESRLVLDDWGTGLNPDMSAILIVQNRADGELDWDGDLDQAFGLMGNLQRDAGFKVGWIGWNGGGVTEKELVQSAKRGWPTVLIRGSQRACDELIAKLEAGDEELLAQVGERHGFLIADRSDPATLRQHLIEQGFLIEA